MGAKMLVSIMMVNSICLIPMIYAQSSGTVAPPRDSLLNPVNVGDCPEQLVNFSSPYVAYAGAAVWEGTQTCGTNYSVSCTGSRTKHMAHPCKKGKSVVVAIVGSCLAPTCANSRYTFLLSKPAFDRIAKGTYPITVTPHMRVCKGDSGILKGGSLQGAL